MTGRNERAEQLEECEGLGAAADGGEPGAAGGKGGGEREAGCLFPLLLRCPFFLIKKLIILFLTNSNSPEVCVCRDRILSPISYSLLLIVQSAAFQSCTIFFHLHFTGFLILFSLAFKYRVR